MTHLQPGDIRPSHLLGTSARGARGTAITKPAYLLGKPGRCPANATLSINLFDNSGSVVGGNDPSANRYVEAQAAIGRISQSCHCGDELTAIYHFDTPTSGDVAPIAIGRKQRTAIARGLAIPSDGRGISELGPSLRVAYDTAAHYPDHDAVLVVYSDFELFDHNLGDVLERFAAFPGRVHAVVLRSQPPQLLLDDDRVQVTPVGYDAPAGEVARAVFDSLTIHRPGRRVYTPAASH